MGKFERAEIGRLCLVKETKDGRIMQIGMTEEQNKMLQLYCAIISQSGPLVEMDEKYDVVLKNNLCAKCKKNNSIK
jgi:hypothetical protein